MMSSWTKQMGFPLITIVDYKYEDGKHYLKLKQQRFLFDGSQDKATWIIPITVCTKSNPDSPKTRFLMSKVEEEFVLNDIPENDWIKVFFWFLKKFKIIFFKY